MKDKETIDMKQNETTKESTSRKERRAFIKKAAYSAPTLLALGQLAKPQKSRAGFGGLPSDPYAGGNP